MTAVTEKAQAAQVAAADPARSSWVAANAGSGKTRVLTNRVARLLLSGTDSQKILCLTYTKAAAAEMQTRLFRTLGTWSMLDDGDLREALAELGGDDLASDAPLDLDRARTLFARALETPGGLKIQTIHAFCEALLRRFPMEAGVAPQFTILEDRQAKALRTDLLDEMAERDPALVGEMAAYLSVDDPDPLLQELGRNRRAFEATLDNWALAARLGTNPSETVDIVADRAITDVDLDLLAAWLPHLKVSGSNDQKAATVFDAALALPSLDRLIALEGVLLTKSGAAPFTAKVGKLPTKALRNAHPELADRLDDLMQRIEEARRQRVGREAYDRAVTLHRFGQAWISALDARKAGPGLLDFDDMIARTSALLSNSDMAVWVLWRLDGGLDHVLVDEAQDTSPHQWEIVRAITDEFFAGEGAREVDRTVFVVGDEKQSIYSFQGADPHAFGDMREHYETVLDGMEAELQRCELIHSFRSAPPILQLVDAVFRGPAGLAFDEPVDHAPNDPQRPGRVEVWPFLPKYEKEEEPPWYAPVDARSPDDPIERLASLIAKRIRSWLQTGQTLPGPKPRAVRARDIMILVQSRSDLFHAIIRALKRRNVPVAGADVLKIGAELAVKDLLACLRVAATPHDDLSLAAMLRSPLGGISEEDLFNLAHARPSLLWRELRESEAPIFNAARTLISDLLGQADFLRPFDLIQRILIRHDGRRKLIARLGSEAEDGIDALIDQALAYESTEPPTLTGFLAWMDRDELRIKRRSEEEADQVRVMTVHGAKGLEAPIVILPDTLSRQEGRNAPDILVTENSEPLWRMPSDRAPEMIRQLEEDRKARARAENLRLLYVALTRAETWLIICGAGKPPKDDEDGWYAMTRAAMDDLVPAREPHHRSGLEQEEDTLVLAHNWSHDTAPKEESGAAAVGRPDWIDDPAPDTPDPPKPLSPSGLGGAHTLAATSELEPEHTSGKAHGDAVHVLLETLPNLPRHDWERSAARLIAPDLPTSEFAIAEARSVLTAPHLGFVFAPGTLAEVEISAPIDALRMRRIEGRIDRLIVEQERVCAIDFKSNAFVPPDPAGIPEGILRQLGAYDAALREIWSDREIETAILWTRTASLMTVPRDLVRDAFKRAEDSLTA
ncbi:MAG: double-strand break repair helicase AddA [Pseudomonadota bacterium]